LYEPSSDGRSASVSLWNPYDPLSPAPYTIQLVLSKRGNKLCRQLLYFNVVLFYFNLEDHIKMSYSATKDEIYNYLQL
jgi:hypothetical protein